MEHNFLLNACWIIARQRIAFHQFLGRNLSLCSYIFQAAKGGENLRLRLAGIDDDDIASGFVVCSRDAAVPAVTYFNAQLQARVEFCMLLTTRHLCDVKACCFHTCARTAIVPASSCMWND